MDSYQIDSIIILSQLQRDGLMAQKQLSRFPHRSKSPIAECIARLKRISYIRSIVALLNAEKIKHWHNPEELLDQRKQLYVHSV